MSLPFHRRRLRHLVLGPPPTAASPATKPSLMGGVRKAQIGPNKVKPKRRTHLLGNLIETRLWEKRTQHRTYTYFPWSSSLSVSPHFLDEMVIPPPARPARLVKFLKPYVLKMHFTNKFVTAQVIHSPTQTVASFASSQEKGLRSSMDTTRDVAAAAKIGKILGERLLLKNIPAVSIHLKREQKYHGKVKAVIDNLREAGIKFV